MEENEMSERVKLSGEAAQALWDAGRRDVAIVPFNSTPVKVRPGTPEYTYTLATDEPLNTPQAIAACKVSPLVEVKRGHSRELRYRMLGGEWQHKIEGGDWKPSEHPPGQSLCKAWRLVAGDVREEAEPVVSGSIEPVRALLRTLAGMEAGEVRDTMVRVDAGRVAPEDAREALAALGPAEPDHHQPLTLPHRTDSLAEAGRHAEVGGVVEDPDGDLYRIRDGVWQRSARLASGEWTTPAVHLFRLGTYILHPADYRDDAAPEPEPVKPKRGGVDDELRAELEAGGVDVRVSLIHSLSELLAKSEKELDAAKAEIKELRSQKRALLGAVDELRKALEGS